MRNSSELTGQLSGKQEREPEGRAPLCRFCGCASRPGFPGPFQASTSVSGLARRQLPEGVPRGRSADLPRALLRVFDGPGLADHGDPDLTRKAELGLDALG